MPAIPVARNLNVSVAAVVVFLFTTSAAWSGPRPVAVTTAVAVPLQDTNPASRPDRTRTEDERPGATRFAVPIGLTFMTPENERMPKDEFLRGRGAADQAASESFIVVLVHGLDDPGWMWREVAPALQDAGCVVARMQYPNDGPIARSADLFAEELEELRSAGVTHVNVVAHSMGGLVTRDVLTRKEYYDGDGSEGPRFPAIDRFILCGPPNHGAKIVRLRAISEIKEQISRTFDGEGGWLGGLSDGAGEAAIDLEPESGFLRSLNARPLPTHTMMTIIAGRMSPVKENDLADLGRKLRDAADDASAPSWLRDWLASADETTSDLLRSAVRGLGDGCVSLESARLPGVEDFVVVPANHVNMIARIIPSVEDPPPAIPIILERLGKSAPKPGTTRSDP